MPKRDLVKRMLIAGGIAVVSGLILLAIQKKYDLPPEQSPLAWGTFLVAVFNLVYIAILQFKNKKK